MNIRSMPVLLLTHGMIALVGFAAGVYALPLLTAPPAPGDPEIRAMAAEAQFTGQFRRDLEDSDLLHWGEGTVSVSTDTISLLGKLAPGPDYKLYLSPEFIETEADFNRLKSGMVRVADVDTFLNFAVSVPAGIDPSDYNSVIIWCEAFGQFITSARYR